MACTQLLLQHLQPCLGVRVVGCEAPAGACLSAMRLQQEQLGLATAPRNGWWQMAASVPLETAGA
jgi:hypothetical protein